MVDKYWSIFIICKQAIAKNNNNTVICKFNRERERKNRNMQFQSQLTPSPLLAVRLSLLHSFSNHSFYASGVTGQTNSAKNLKLKIFVRIYIEWTTYNTLYRIIYPKRNESRTPKTMKRPEIDLSANQYPAGAAAEVDIDFRLFKGFRFDFKQYW